MFGSAALLTSITRISAGMSVSATAVVPEVMTSVMPPVIVDVTTSDFGSSTNVFFAQPVLRHPSVIDTHGFPATVTTDSGTESKPSLIVVCASGAPSYEYAVTTPPLLSVKNCVSDAATSSSPPVRTPPIQCGALVISNSSAARPSNSSIRFPATAT